MQKSVLDTSPIILEYGKRYKTRGDIVEETDSCITIAYDYEAVRNDDRYLTHYGLRPTMIDYENGVYKDYWNYDSKNAELLSVPLILTANQIAFTIYESMLDDCYAYQSYTGKIFFAGKNSIYYGHKNISELN